MKLTVPALFFFFFLCSFSALAQSNYVVKGMIADSAAKMKLGGTTVTILNAKDSIMRAFTWADENGAFSINKMSKGKYFIMVTYPGYADYVEDFTLDSVKTQKDFGVIDMILKSRLLADVIIKGEVTAIKIKGDTTEYNAKAYKIEPNAKVEDLLKQLPGIEVDKDGKITAQGQTVNKVLVDGEEFFGDDPTLVTKNIRADMVDKVQLYDKKSDQATFTGIDDGVKEKTINIKLKADKKDGYFGKVDAGVGTDDYYQSQLLFNLFKEKEKFSVYGTLGNTGKVGLGWEDSQKAGLSNDNIQFGDGGGIMIFSNGGDDDLDSFNGHYDGQGIPLARSAGAHYDGKWDSDKQSINTNYKVGSIQVTGTNDNINQNNLPDSINNSTSHQTFNKFMFRQKLDVTYQVKLDTAQTLKIAVDGTEKHSDLTQNNTSTSYLNDTLLNRNTNQLINHVNTNIFDASAFYTRKFKKAGRTLSFLVSEAINQSNAQGYLKSNTAFYQKGVLDTSQIIDEYKTAVNNSAILNTNLTYTEPLTKRLSVIFNYALGVDNGTSNRLTYDSTAVGQYKQLDDSLSSDYKLNQLSNQVGAIFNYKKDKNIVNFGAKVADVSFNQIDGFTGDVYKRHFLNWQPQASYQYRFSQQQSFQIYYNGSTTQPTIGQIQPIKNNNDPLNITVGNPDLKPSFNNNFNLNYNSYKIISGQNIYAYGSFQFTSDPIVSNTSFQASTGKNTFQSVNLPNKTPYNFYAGAYMGQKITKGDFNVGMDLNINGSTSYNYTNNVLNITDSYNYSGQLRFSKYVVKKYEFNIAFGPSYTINQSSLQPLVNNNGLGYNGYGYFSVYLPGKFQISSDDNYQFTPKTESFDHDFSKLIINTSLIKSFFKEENFKITLSGNDLLNQNVGFSRNAYGNTINQNSYTTIKRYFMLSVTWDFNKMGLGAAKK